MVVVSDALAAQFGAPGSGTQQAAGQQAAGQQAAAGDEDAELEALLQQMDIGRSTGGGPSGGGSSGAALGTATGGWGSGSGGVTSSAAAPDASIAGLLDSLGIGDEPAAQAGPVQQVQQAQQGQQAQQAPAAPSAASYSPLDVEPGVHILSTAAYWGGVWGHVPAVADVFDSVQQSKAEEARQGGGGGGFLPHLSHAAMEAGLASGALLSGTLCVSRRVPGEATVAVGGGRQLLISGRAALNRAIHGDRVAVRLLPREQWRPAAELAAPAAAGGSAAGAAEEEGEADEHDLLAATGDGEAGVAADGAAEAADGEDEPLDAVVGAARRFPGLAIGPVARSRQRLVCCGPSAGQHCPAVWEACLAAGPFACLLQARLLMAAADDELQPTAEVVGILQASVHALFICSSSLLRCYGDAAVECCLWAPAFCGEFQPVIAAAAATRDTVPCSIQPAGFRYPAMQRWSGEIVACISEDDERALASKQASDRQVRLLWASCLFVFVCLVCFCSGLAAWSSCAVAVQSPSLGGSPAACMLVLKLPNPTAARFGSTLARRGGQLPVLRCQRVPNRHPIALPDAPLLSPPYEPQESVLCIPTDRRLPKLRLRSRQLHRLLGQVGVG